jgi:hypothetical protein
MDEVTVVSAMENRFGRSVKQYSLRISADVVESVVLTELDSIPF